MWMGAVNQTVESGDAPERETLERLLAQVANRDRDALGELYRRTRGAVYALALGLLRRAHDAQDVTQDTFVKVWEAAPGYRPQGSPMAWMLTITRNLCRMRLRQAGRLVELTEAEWDAIPADAPGVSPEDRQLLQTALASLGDQERQVVLLHAEGLKHREIASLLELSLPAVLSIYHRAIKKLRVQLKGDDPL